MALGWFDTLGGELAFILTLFVGYAVGRLLEVLIKYDLNKKDERKQS